jgi:DNA polymerase-3 subunit epsilon
LRQIVLDTETTGLEAQDGHRIIEIGCVELLNRRLTQNRFHYYLNPERQIDEGAIEVHGITNESLLDKPHFNDVSTDLLTYLQGAELIIHNAPFDVGFLDAEFKRVDAKWPGIASHCTITDTLQMARRLHPGQKNNLDALCKRYAVDNSQRELHGALLDAEILAEVYLAMTGGQTSLGLDQDTVTTTGEPGESIQKLKRQRPALRVIRVNDEEAALHEQRLNAIEKAAGQAPVWRLLDNPVVAEEI